MLLMKGFPPDIRVEKEIHSLSKDYELHILCNATKGQSIHDELDGVKITRIPPSLRRSFSQLEIIVKQDSSIWFNAISDFVSKSQIHVLHVHDLPLVGVALKVAQKHGIKLVADLHENYPAMLKESTRIPLYRIRNLGNLALKLFFSEKKWRNFEEKVLPLADAVICVVEEAKVRLAEIQVKDELIYVVPNYNLMTKGFSKTSSISTNNKEIFTLLYAGGVDDTRDLNTLVESLKHLKVGTDNLKVIVVGADSKSKIQLESFAKRCGVDHLFEVYTWVSREKVETIIKSTDVGLVPHRKSEHTDTTIPHKIFQYMFRGLPLIVSNCAPLERIVTEYECGLVYTSGESLSLSKCIETLYEQPSLRAKYGEKGKIACTENFNWSEAEKKLLELYYKINT